MKKLLSGILILLGVATSLYARDIVYKVSTYGDDANDGLTWATAKRTLQAAQAVAEYGDDIWVAAGIYYPTDGNNRFRWGGSSDADVRYFSFQLKSGVRIYGGFPKLGNPDMSNRDFVNNKTIFSGNIGDSTTNTDNTYRIFYNTDASIDDLTVLDGVYIQDAYNNYSTTATDNNGGGIYNSGSSPLIRNTTFSNNYAANVGGAVHNADSSSPYISDSSFVSNSAANGSSISHQDGGVLTLTKCKFSSNNNSAIQAIGTTNISGCDFNLNSIVISVSGTKKHSITNSNFTKNSGNSIFIDTAISTTSTITVTNCTFTENTGTPIQNLNNGSTVNNCSFNKNTVKIAFLLNTNSSAGISMSGGNVTNCTFLKNSASPSSSSSSSSSYYYTSASAYSYAGGGIHMSGGNVTNCTFSKNTSESISNATGRNVVKVMYSAGGINIGGGIVKFCTLTENFSKNTEGNYSGGIYSSDNYNIQNCIIWGNYSHNGRVVDEINGNYSNVSNCVIQNGYSGGSNIITEKPKLLPLGNYGGGTLTMPVDAGSSAIVGNKQIAGLLGKYYNAGTYACSRNDPTINFDWGNGASPISGVNGTNWSAEWTGKIIIPTSTSYTFTNVKSMFSTDYFYNIDGTNGAVSNIGNSFANLNSITLSSLYNENSDDVSIKSKYSLMSEMTIRASKNVSVDLAFSNVSGATNVYNSENVTLANYKASDATAETSVNTKFFNVELLNSTASAAVVRDSSKTYFTNCVMYNAANGGIIMSGSDRVMLMNCTIYNNGTNGITADDSTDCAIFNTIIWGHSKSLAVNASVSDSWTIGYCNIEGGYSNGTNIITENPRIHPATSTCSRFSKPSPQAVSCSSSSK